MSPISVVLYLEAIKASESLCSEEILQLPISFHKLNTCVLADNFLGDGLACSPSAQIVQTRIAKIRIHPEMGIAADF
jgi:hypothetical protein